MVTRLALVLLLACYAVFVSYMVAAAGDHPRATFHAFDQQYSYIESAIQTLLRAKEYRTDYPNDVNRGHTGPTDPRREEGGFQCLNT